jgi:hypothetical protein
MDAFIDKGKCQFMMDFARPYPGLAFFDQVLYVPTDQLVEINDMATAASLPNDPKGREVVTLVSPPATHYAPGAWLTHLFAIRKPRRSGRA